MILPTPARPIRNFAGVESMQLVETWHFLICTIRKDSESSSDSRDKITKASRVCVSDGKGKGKAKQILDHR